MSLPVPTTDSSAPVLSPEWWMDRLLGRLDARRLDLLTWEAYYEGIHPLNFFDESVAAAFGHRFRRFASNFVALVIDGLAERINVNGFRFRDDQGDDDLWAIWQENDLDGGSQMAHTDALVKRVAYTLVEPRGEDFPRITIEDALDTIVELDPRDRRKRLAGLKRWIGDDDHLYVIVYLPDALYKYRSREVYRDTTSSRSPGMEPWRGPGDAVWPLRNPLREVPLVPLPNRPRARSYEGRSEVAVIASNQDLINYYRVMAVISARYTAYPQRWVKNLAVEIDAVTGLPAKPFKGGMSDIWQVSPFDPDDPRSQQSASQVEFGQFPASSVDPYIHLIEHEIGAMASISAMPYHYLLGTPQSVPPSAESIKASESRLVSKVRSIETYFGEGWEETMRLALRAMRDERADLRTAETRWSDPATRNEAVRTDSVVKLTGADVIDNTTALEELGYSPAQIKRIQQRQKKEAKAEAAASPPPPPPAPAPGEPGAEVVPAPTGPQMSPTPRG